ncbi:MAG TPA: choice-of-anchor D domain-containing protein [Candidatus Binatia bacterium]|nr:choice-of-anchor D domain-containing protein [Candidatus Binatia bacterium]
MFRRVADVSLVVLSLCAAGLLHAQTATLTPSSLTFGDQVINTSSAAQVATLKNTGTTTLTLSSISVSGQFSQTHTCGMTLRAGASCTISVTFKPTSMGNLTGTLTVKDSATNSPQRTSLSGTGINTPIPAKFFAMDINQHNGTDPWPGTAGTGASGVSFETYRTLGSSINWSDLYDCSNNEYTFNEDPSSNQLLTWASLAYAGGQSIMFTAYYTPDCLVPSSVQTTTGTSWCAFHNAKTQGGETQYYGCDLPNDVLQNQGQGLDHTWITFIQNVVTYLSNTTYFPNGWPTIYIEVWNEPNVNTECNSTTSRNPGNCTYQSLAQMVADANTYGKQINPNVKIISPAVTGNLPQTGDCTGTPETINTYLSSLLGATPAVVSNSDFIGFHGYGGIPQLGTGTYDPAAGASCVANLISSVQSTVGSATTTAIPIYDTEGSWGTGGDASIDGSSYPYENQAEEAAFTGAYYLIQASNSVCSTSPCFGMAGFSWYGWDFDNQGDPGSTGQFWDQTTDALTAAGVAYTVLQPWLANASPVGPCTLYQPLGTSTTLGVWTCQFQGSGSSAGLAVWDNTQTCLGVTTTCGYPHLNWQIPSSLGTYSEWRDLYGNPVNSLNGASTVNIGLVPILLDNGTAPQRRGD